MNTIDWQAPSALTYATWQSAHADCQALLNQSQFNPTRIPAPIPARIPTLNQAHLSAVNTVAITIDWQRCKQIDSSALAFILQLKRSTATPIVHKQAPLALCQLAKLYEVDDVLGLE